MHARTCVYIVFCPWISLSGYKCLWRYRCFFDHSALYFLRLGFLRNLEHILSRLMGQWPSDLSPFLQCCYTILPDFTIVLGIWTEVLTILKHIFTPNPSPYPYDTDFDTWDRSCHILQWVLRSDFTDLKGWLGFGVIFIFRSSCLSLFFGYQ